MESCCDLDILHLSDKLDTFFRFSNRLIALLLVSKFVRDGEFRILGLAFGCTHEHLIEFEDGCIPEEITARFAKILIRTSFGSLMFLERNTRTHLIAGSCIATIAQSTIIIY